MGHKINLRVSADEFKKKLNVTNGIDGKDGKTPVKGVDYFDGKDSFVPGPKGEDGKNGIDGKDGISIQGPKGDKGDKGDPGKDAIQSETDIIILAEKLAPQIEYDKIKGIPNLTKLSGGLSRITKPEVQEMLDALPVSSDEKVKYDVNDPTAGYIADKFKAGTGISLAEGTGADENKLIITNDAPAPEESDPLSIHLNGDNSPTENIDWGGKEINNISYVGERNTIAPPTNVVISKVATDYDHAIWGSNNTDFLVKVYSYKTINSVKYYSAPVISNAVILNESDIYYVKVDFTGATGVDGYYVTFSYAMGVLSNDYGNQFVLTDYDYGFDISTATTYNIDGLTIQTRIDNPTFTTAPAGTSLDITNDTINISKLGKQTTNGFVTTTNDDGTIVIDTNTYLTEETDPVFSSWLSTTPPLYPGGWYDTDQSSVNISGFNNDSGYLTYNGSISYADNSNYSNYTYYTANYQMTVAGNYNGYVMDDAGNYLNASNADYWAGYSFPYYDYGTPGYFYNDGYGSLSFQNIDFSSYVPYTGASSDVDLGTYALTTTGKITGELAKVDTSAPTEQVGNLWLDTDETINYITTVTDTYTILSTDLTVVCNKATAFTVTLPPTVVGQTLIIKNIGAGVVTVDGDGSDTIDGETTQTINQWSCLTIQCSAANSWIII